VEAGPIYLEVAFAMIAWPEGDYGHSENPIYDKHPGQQPYLQISNLY